MRYGVRGVQIETVKKVLRFRYVSMCPAKLLITHRKVCHVDPNLRRIY